MATGRTISANLLTTKDEEILKLCESISKHIISCISTKLRKEYNEEFGKISYTRDGGAGRGAGKIQRDALCTRGRGGKAPFSNRNLRWHPLVVAEKNYGYSKSIDSIRIEGQDESQTLVFIVNGKKYPSDRIYELHERYVVLPNHWLPHIDKLKHWSDTLWTQNSCVIPALEACDWQDAVETYTVLGMAIAVELYDANFADLYDGTIKLLRKQNISKSAMLPSKRFPKTKDNFIYCPMCKAAISDNAAEIPARSRGSIWQPGWRSNKREEGNDSSIQITHVSPLNEQCLVHNASTVRYGHRWCNVAMTDHSLDETLDFMEYIVRAHNRCKQ